MSERVGGQWYQQLKLSKQSLTRKGATNEKITTTKARMELRRISSLDAPAKRTAPVQSDLFGSLRAANETLPRLRKNRTGTQPMRDKLIKISSQSGLNKMNKEPFPSITQSSEDERRRELNESLAFIESQQAYWQNKGERHAAPATVTSNC